MSFILGLFTYGAVGAGVYWLAKMRRRVLGLSLIAGGVLLQWLLIGSVLLS